MPAIRPGIVALGLLTGAYGFAGAERTGTPQSVRPPVSAADSAEVLDDAQRTMRDYVRGAAQSATLDARRNLPVYTEEIREQRLRVIDALDGAARTIPGDDWIVGHRVGLRVKADRLDEALAVAAGCVASDWWCAALEGFVHHVRGDSLSAHVSFEGAVGAMPAAELCAWQKELGEILVGSLRRPYQGADCAELDELARRMWWLADPFHLLPWNDWRSEHFTRLVGMRLHHQSLALTGDRCGWEHHTSVLLHGWPEWWWGHDRGFPTPTPPSHQFLPPPGVALDPFASEAWDWDLIEDPYLEYMDLGYELIHDLDQQTAFFARGDSLLVAASAEMDRHALRGEPSVTAGIALSAGPLEPSMTAVVQGPPEHLRFSLTAPPGAYLVSVEAIADTWGAARARFGGRLPDPAPSGLGLSDLLLFDWDDALAEEFDAVFPRMLGTHRFSTSREVGVYWETYGAEADDELEVSLRVVSLDEGFIRRLGRALRIVGRQDAVHIAWTERAAEGAVPGRSLRLGLRDVEPGPYVVELQVRSLAEGGEAAVVRRRIEVDWR